MRRRLPRPPRNAEADGLHRSGVQRYERGDLKGALRDYTRALRFDPRRADILNDRGIVRKAMGDARLAMDDYGAAIETDPGFWAAYANRGTLLAQRGDYDGALVEFDRGIRIRPREATLYYYRANSRGCVMDYDGALTDYTKALRLDPRLGAAWFGRGGTHQLLATLRSADGHVLVPGKTYRPSRAASRRHLKAALADFRRAKRLARPGCGYLQELPALLREVEAALR